MAELNLDERLQLTIDAVRGDDFGPVTFVFCNPDETIENLAGATYEGILKNTQGDILKTLDNTTELIFTASESKLVWHIDEDFTADYASLLFIIKQTIGDVVKTRIYGKIIFKN